MLLGSVDITAAKAHIFNHLLAHTGLRKTGHPEAHSQAHSSQLWQDQKASPIPGLPST